MTNENTAELISKVLYPDGREEQKKTSVISEHVLNVSVNEQPVYRLVCTKDHLNELVAGRLLTDGLISESEDIDKILFCPEYLTARVFLNNAVTLDHVINEDKSCCTGNKVFAANLKGYVLKKLPKVELMPEQIFALAGEFSKETALHGKTGGTHSCILASEGKTLFVSEDIGRHNAVDKAIGFALLNGIDLFRCMLFTSGRVPVDMVQKVISAGIPVLVSKSVPTAESVELAREYGLNLVCRAWPDKCEVY